MRILFCLCGALMWWHAANVRAADGEPLIMESVVLSPLDAAEVPAQQVGMLREIVVEEGATVEAGAILARLDDRQAKIDVEQARVEVAQAEAKAGNRVKVEYAEKSLAVAKAELKRSQESIAQFAKSISQSQIDVEQLTVEKLALEKKQAEHELELERFALELKRQELAEAELNLDLHSVRAPFAGTVVVIRGRVGEWVEAGTPVVRLVAVDTLRAEGFLAAQHASSNLVGRKVLFRGENGTMAMGTLKFVSPEMDAVTRQVRVWAELENTDGHLRSGEHGSLEIKN